MRQGNFKGVIVILILSTSTGSTTLTTGSLSVNFVEGEGSLGLFMKVNILGVNIDDVSENKAIDIVKSWLKDKTKRYIVTPNPEFLMLAQKDSEFKRVLNQADLAIPDGVGLKMSGKIKNTTPGVDLMEKLISKSEDWGATIGFLGGKKGVAEKLAECLLAKYPSLKITFASDGGIINKDGNMVGQVDSSKYPATDLLFVAFGQGKQEKWIARNLPKIPVKVAMGVGGSFDYLSGNITRAPKVLRKLGLEWLFRLITQPWRASRQLVLIQFVLLLWWKRIISMVH
ncbi:MAG: WecB/TagA/CpsF family glycosyltransferase [Candidatus Daviesbacteria bacterium]|nr:MAG: WecB/TagA/CpsF family glycosyltransferase [Candidatus Daviesbacteria bacterium]